MQTEHSKNLKGIGKPLAACALFILSLSVLVLSSCVGGGGGGGGGGDSLEPAEVIIDASPVKIDSGDRMRVTLDLYNIDEKGVLLKVRYPIQLDYIEGSSYLRVLGEKVEINPAVNITTGNSGEEFTYLVYDLPKTAFGEQNDATLGFILEGTSATTDGVIAVDPDFNDPSLTIDEKFSGTAPQFDPVQSFGIEVRDSSGLITPSPTPTPTITNTPAPTNTPRPTATPTNTRVPRATATSA